MPAKLENQLRELNTLRNWIVHGFSYKTTYLIEPETEGVYNVVDMEDSVDWQKKFPNTKFKPLDRLGVEDARLALTIVLEILRIMSDSMHQPISICTYVPKANYKILFEDEFNIQEIVCPTE
jgi:hypothetical protein